MSHSSQGTKAQLSIDDTEIQMYIYKYKEGEELKKD